MEPVHNLICVHLPDYFRALPIPESFGGWFRLAPTDWARLIPFGVAMSGLSYLTLKGLAQAPGIGPAIQQQLSKVPGFQPVRVNNQIKVDAAKVVDTIDIEDMGDKGVFCRCWKSKKFPYCDGSHNKHNQDTGDNVGPLIIKKSA